MDKRLIKFKRNLIIGSVIFLTAAILLGFFCKYDKPLYSHVSTSTYTGLCTDIDFRLFVGNGSRHPYSTRNQYAVLTMDNGEKYSIAPKFLYTDNSITYSNQRSAFKEKLLMKNIGVTSAKDINLNGYYTVFELAVDDEIIISAETVNNAHTNYRIRLWGLYLFAVVAYIGILFIQCPPSLIFKKRKSRKLR